MVINTNCYEIQHNGDLIFCKDKLCNIEIDRGDPAFLDTLYGEIYCHQCGKCLRYARKKALERGESIQNVEW